MPNEIELKLRIAKADIPRLRHHAVIRYHLMQKAITRRLVSTYYDTPNLQLFDKRVSLRVRRMSGGWFQAVKAAGHSLAGLHQRLEWEDIIAKGEPDYTKINDPSLTPIFDDLALRQALKPIFTTDMRRSEWQLDYQGSHIELSLDDGLLIAGEHQQPLIEIELELKQGQVGHLFALALELQADIPLIIENVSKAQRGYAYYRDFPLQASKARPADITPDDKPDEAFEKAGWECLRHLQSNQPLAMQGTDPEGVHQMRVALRRLKVVLNTFGMMHADIREELDWLGGLLAKPRDPDVFLHEILPSLKLSADEIAHIQPQLANARKRAYSALRNGLAQARYQRLLLTLGHLFSSGLPAKYPDLTHIVSRQLQGMHKKLLKQGKQLASLSINEKHRLRGQVRRLRYAMELFSPLYLNKKHAGKKAEKQAAALLDALNELQDSLGTLNDIVIAGQRLQRMSQRNPALHPIRLTWEKAATKREKRCLTGLPASWKALKQAAVFW